MKNVPVETLKEGASVESVYLVNRKQVRTTKSGSSYLDLELRDKTGAVSGKYWDVPARLASSVTEGTCVKVKARVGTFMGQVQLNLTAVSAVPAEEIDPREFLPGTKGDVKEMVSSLRRRCGEIANAHLGKLLTAFLDDKEFMAKFAMAPAASMHHHAWLGGLLEHTCSMVALADKICDCYDFLDRDIVVTGAFLHDIGKVDELAYATTLSYSDRGGLVGHIVLGVAMLDRKINECNDFPAPLADVVRHLIVSHHGQKEWGSPQVPAIPEAILLHYIDNIDAKLAGARVTLDAARGQDGSWTEFNRMLECRLYRMDP